MDGTETAAEHLSAEHSSLVWRAVAAPGKPLEAPVQSTLGRAFDHDFTAVRVHADAASTQALKARAYPFGTDVVFSPAHYESRSSLGLRLLAHELAHVAQQASSPAPFVQRDTKHDEPADRTMEILPAHIGALEAIIDAFSSRSSSARSSHAWSKKS